MKIQLKIWKCFLIILIEFSNSHVNSCICQCFHLNELTLMMSKLNPTLINEVLLLLKELNAIQIHEARSPLEFMENRYNFDKSQERKMLSSVELIYWSDDFSIVKNTIMKHVESK